MTVNRATTIQGSLAAEDRLRWLTQRLAEDGGVTIAAAAVAMLKVPADVNFLEAIVLPRDQHYLGRG